MPINIDPDDEFAVYTKDEVDDLLAALPSGGGTGTGPTDAQVLAAVATYVAANPITPAGPTAAQVATAVTAYLVANPVSAVPPTAAQVTTAVNAYLVAHPVTAPGPTDAQVQAQVAVYIAAHPQSGGGATDAQVQAQVAAYLVAHPIGGATTTPLGENVLSYGADPTGAGDSTLAFRNAAATGKPVLVPPGNFRCATTPILDGSNLSITGSGNQSSITLGAGQYLIDAANVPDTLTIKDLFVQNGAGCYRQRSTASSVSGHRTIMGNRFYQYTKAAISNESPDSPYWHIENNQFWGANFTTCVGIALAGWPDGSNLDNNSFLENRIAIKLGGGAHGVGGPNGHIQGNDFLRFGDGQGFPRVDIWVVPCDASFEVIASDGLFVQGNKYGNEFLNTGDFRVLFADEQGSGLVGDRMPNVSTASAGFVTGVTFTHENHIGGGSSGAVPFIRSMTPNVDALQCTFINQTGNIAPLLSLKTRTGFTSSTNIVGPQKAHNGINTTTLTVADDGAVTQCPKVMIG